MKKKQPAPASDAPRRCAIYTRKSTTHGLDQEFNSLDAQREACAAYIRRQPNWGLVAERYDDGGFTGANIERPAFQRLMADVESGKLDIVIVYKVDRLSRSLLDFAKVMERLGKANASFVSVTQNFSTADAMGRLTMNLLASFAEFEREMISERTRDKIAATRRRGKWTGGPCPLGYKVEAKKLVINDDEAPVVREAFRLLLEHRRMSTVASLMNRRELLPRKTKRNPGPRRTKDTIAKVLRNPVYNGFISYYQEQHAGEHEPLIDRVTFERAQAVLAGSERHLKFHGVNYDYVLRGLLVCGLCGKPMTPGSTRKGRREYRYYRCTTRDKHGKAECAARPLAAPALEGYVVDRIATAASSSSLRSDIHTSMEAKLKEKQAALEAVKQAAPQLIATHSVRASKLIEELSSVDGKAREAVAEQLTAETAQLEAAEQSLSDAERGLVEVLAVIEEFTPVLETLDDFREAWAIMTPENRVRLMAALIDDIRVDDKAGSVRVTMIDFAGVEAA
jgi:DNA invertase Pin-like site-specific DNA recombinase